MLFVVLLAPVTKLQLAQLLLAMNDGRHANYSWVILIPVRAFRLVPDLKENECNSYLTIDGEKLDSQPVQVQVMPRKGRVFTR